MNDNLTKYWDSICQIYFLTKHYLLLAEELSDDFDTFLQPVKEHRDAFDHIARVYGYKFLQNEIKNIDKYLDENMRKAVGHAYRAFFDTADWLSYICRHKIRKLLNSKTYDEIVAVYPEYPEVKKLLLEAPLMIANIRESKDVSDNVNELVETVREYRILLDRLIDAYQGINSAF